MTAHEQCDLLGEFIDATLHGRRRVCAKARENGASHCSSLNATENFATHIWPQRQAPSHKTESLKKAFKSKHQR
jgi:hypothetical protein